MAQPLAITPSPPITAPIDFGLVLPSYRRGASAEGIESATETAARLGWESVWTTDHLLVGPPASEEYGHLFEAVATLAYLGGREPRLLLGTSVIVVPLRNAVILARQLASIDVLTRGRLVVGVGIGWNEPEFRNLGVAERFRHRGAYLDESVQLWRHLWSGSAEPFGGRFHRFADVAFSPLPTRGANLPIWVGGRSERALARAGRLGDGYQASQTSPAQLAVRVPLIRQAALATGRPMPRISARVHARFGPHEGTDYALAGTPEQMLAEISAFRAQGASHLAVDFAETDPTRLAGAMERFDREVVRVLRERDAQPRA